MGQQQGMGAGADAEAMTELSILARPVALPLVQADEPLHKNLWCEAQV